MRQGRMLMLGVLAACCSVSLAAPPVAIAGRLVTETGKPVPRAQVQLAASDREGAEVAQTSPNADGLFLLGHSGVLPGTELYLVVDDGVITMPIAIKGIQGQGPVNTIALTQPLVAVAEASPASISEETAEFAVAAAHKTAELLFSLGQLSETEAREQALVRSANVLARVEDASPEAIERIAMNAAEVGEQFALPGGPSNELSIDSTQLADATNRRVEVINSALEEIEAGRLTRGSLQYVLEIQPNDIPADWVVNRFNADRDPERLIRSAFVKLGEPELASSERDPGFVIYTAEASDASVTEQQVASTLLVEVAADTAASTPIRISQLVESGFAEAWLQRSESARSALFYTYMLDEYATELDARAIQQIADRLGDLRIRVDQGPN